MASDETARPNAASDDEVIPEAGRGVDLQPDVERLHRAIRREPHDPVEGREAAPWFFVASVAIAFLWGGWYMGRYGGEFNRSTHIALGRRDAATGGAAATQVAAAIADPVAAGAQLYTKNCAACHQGTGKGVAGAFPPLIGSEWVTGSAETVIRILLNGLQGPMQVAGATYNGAMPAWQEALKDEEIAAIATYIRQWKPNAAPPVSTAQVATLRTAGASRSAPWTAAELQSAGAVPAGDSPAAPAAPGAAAAAPTTAPTTAPATRGTQTSKERTP